MPFYGKIVLVVTFALVFTRANVFAQGSAPESTPMPFPVSAVDPMLIELGCDSILKAQGLTRVETRIYLDTMVPRLQQYCLKRTVSNPRATIVIKQLAALQQEGCRNCEIIPNQSTGTTVYGQAVLMFDSPTKASIPFAFHSGMVYNGPVLLPEAIEPPQKNDGSFWDSTAQPIIVTLGAAVIVALFFLIRS